MILLCPFNKDTKTSFRNLTVCKKDSDLKINIVSLSITNDYIVHSATFWGSELDTSSVVGVILRLSQYSAYFYYFLVVFLWD